MDWLLNWWRGAPNVNEPTALTRPATLEITVSVAETPTVFVWVRGPVLEGSSQQAFVLEGLVH